MIILVHITYIKTFEMSFIEIFLNVIFMFCTQEGIVNMFTGAP